VTDSGDEARDDPGRRRFLMGALVGAGTTAGICLAIGSRDTRGERQARGAKPAEGGLDRPGTTMAAPGEIPPPPEDIGPMPPDGRRLSYAQQGEDLVLRKLFELLEIDRPTYLDIGACHPTISSNTFLLYVLGSRGVLVEPNPYMANLLTKARPGDRVLNVGVGFDDRSEADFYVIRNRPQLNTFSKQQADRIAARSGPAAIERVVKLPLVEIDDILATHFDRTPDLLSIDIEGLDLAVLRTMDFDRFRPAVLCVETIVEGTLVTVDGTEELMRSKGYAVRASTVVNTIFVDEQRLPAVEPPHEPRAGE
jgi:FkbM family methyltransferase